MKIEYYHLVQRILHSINGYLVYLVLIRFLSKKKAFLASLFFVISWTHFYELTWIASTFNSVSLLFILLYFISCFRARIKTGLVFFFLICSLLSIETAVVLPLFHLAYWLFFNKTGEKKRFAMVFLVQVVIIGLYLLLRFKIFVIPAYGSYEIEISKNTIKNLIYYILWLLNIPEAAIVHLKINWPLLTVMDNWFSETFLFYVIFLTCWLIFSFCCLILSISCSFTKSVNRINLFFCFWFAVSIVPVLAIPKRAYPYYPFIAQIGFWAIMASLLVDQWRFFLAKIFLIGFLIGNLWAVRFNNVNHWIFASSDRAKTYFNRYLSYKIKTDKKIVFWRIPDLTVRYSLTDGLAFNVYFNDYQTQYVLDETKIDPNSPEIFNVENYLAEEKAKKDYQEYLRRFKKINHSNTPTELTN